MQINSFKDLIVFQKAYKAAMEIFEITQYFLKEEKYSLTDKFGVHPDPSPQTSLKPGTNEFIQSPSLAN